MPIPSSTYRLQFHAGFTFADATAIIPYLHDLGVTHVYASPYLKARPGSTHGYDVIDHRTLNPELGTRADFEAFVAALRSRGMGHILDIVPNHVGVATNDNAWWNDVLAHGPDSAYANYFDIAWHASPRAEMQNKVLLPVLGEPYGKVLEAGQLQLRQEGDRFFVYYYDLRFPIAPRTVHKILRAGADPAEALARLNGMPGDPASFDLLDDLLSDQSYRLAYWRVAPDEINYRRFFDINELAALCMERQEVFDAAHEFVFDLIREGKLDGLRVDHPDGLYDPRQYFERLRRGAPPEHNPLFVVVEKILALNEPLPDDWPVSGTSGYDFLAHATGLFVDPGSGPALTNLYQDFTGIRTAFPELVYAKKRLILRISLAGELHMLARLLDRLARRDRHARDFTFNGLRDALREVIACFPVYRSYISAGGVHASDEQHIERAVRDAIARNPATEASIFHYIRDRVLQRPVRGFTDDDRAAQLRFAGKFQQLTAPVTAKGVEDTAFYIYNRLISLNDVGGDPDQFGTPPEAFHAYLAHRQSHWPGGLSPLSTHDTKRSEDVRARINVLSEIPEQWAAAVARWRDINAAHRGPIDPNDDYLLYQTLVGAYPLDDRELPDFPGRIQAYLQKALREAKVHTSWTRPDQAYEAAVQSFAARILSPDTGGSFLADFLPFQRRVAACGLYNSLAQTLLRLTAPGIPDTYQGTELWDFSLVDPDNRRPVDYWRRAELLAALDNDTRDRPALVRDLLANKEDGRVKLFTTATVLRHRRAHPDLYAEGEYVPLKVTGENVNHVFAFARRHEGKTSIAVIPRFFSTLLAGAGNPVFRPQVWSDTEIHLPAFLRALPCVNLFTAETVSPAPRGDLLLVGQILAGYPVALLVSN